MTPAARRQAAIEIMDQILTGTAAEKALTGWARRSRYAGSGDRAAVRDHVFDALRRKRSDSALGGGMTGRGLTLGALRRRGIDPDTVFTGTPYAPAPLADPERQPVNTDMTLAEQLDIPDWLLPRFLSSLGDNAEAAAIALQSRAPLHLRVNLTKGDRDSAIAALAGAGIRAIAHAASRTALEVTDGPRRVRQSAPYLDGRIELQDGASQAVVDALPLKDGMRVLDYCAGGGGKALAMAARAKIALFVHDIDPGRMSDLPERAARAGAEMTRLASDEIADAGPFDLVLCDAPCSGSGAWRRAPEGKWSLTPAQLVELTQTQGEILRSAARLTAENGVLAYVTCSLLSVENDARIADFLDAEPGWYSPVQQAWPVQDGTDGFYLALLTRE